MGIAVVWRPAQKRVGDEHIPALHPDFGQQLVQQLPGLAHERQAHAVLVGPGGFAHEHQLGIGIARAEHDGGAGNVQRATRAVARLKVFSLQQLPALGSASHGARW